MKEEEIEELARSGYYKEKPLHGDIEETHISWVLLTEKFAFKIKKPVKRSFLDFSTLDKRKELCEKELHLNRRFSDIYLAVLPVREDKGRLSLGEGPGEVIDYAVHMKRMAFERKMSAMLGKGEVTQAHMRPLAEVVAAIHMRAGTVTNPFDPEREGTVFNDIHHIEAFVKEAFGLEQAALVGRAIDWSDKFLEMHRSRFQKRIDLGFRRDIHGDLHAGNIFLYPKPVIFDCLEFNDDYRQIDVLREAAFICMDMEAYGCPHLAEAFLSLYAQYFPCMPADEDKAIFLYYKCCCANVRAKISAGGLQDSGENDLQGEQMTALRTYLSLMRTYMDRL